MGILSKETFKAGTAESIVWSDSDIGVLLVEHSGISSSGTAPIQNFAAQGYPAPQVIVANGTPANNYIIGRPRLEAGSSTRARFRNISGFVNQAQNCNLHWEGYYIRGGAPFTSTTKDGKQSLTVGSNAQGFYAEFRTEGVLQRPLCIGQRAGVLNQNPAPRHNLPINMGISDFYLAGNVITNNAFPYFVNQNAVNATQFEFYAKNGFSTVTNQFGWIAEAIIP